MLSHALMPRPATGTMLIAAADLTPGMALISATALRKTRRAPRVCIGRGPEPERWQPFRVESRIDALQQEETADEQPCTHEQHDGERKFRDDERAADPRGAARPTGAFAKCNGGPAGRKLPGRNETEQDARHQRNHAYDRHHRPVERDLFDPWQVGRELRDQQRQRPSSDCEADQATKQAEQRAFGEELPHDAAAPAPSA